MWRLSILHMHYPVLYKGWEGRKKGRWKEKLPFVVQLKLHLWFPGQETRHRNRLWLTNQPSQPCFLPHSHPAWLSSPSRDLKSFLPPTLALLDKASLCCLPWSDGECLSCNLARQCHGTLWVLPVYEPVFYTIARASNASWGAKNEEKGKR